MVEHDRSTTGENAAGPIWEQEDVLTAAFAHQRDSAQGRIGFDAVGNHAHIFRLEVNERPMPAVSNRRTSGRAGVTTSTPSNATLVTRYFEGHL